MADVTIAFASPGACYRFVVTSVPDHRYTATAMTSAVILLAYTLRRTWQQQGTAEATWPGL